MNPQTAIGTFKMRHVNDFLLPEVMAITIDYKWNQNSTKCKPCA